MEKIIKKLQSGDSFLKSIAPLISSNIATQIIALAALPILTRLYQPSDFGVLAFFSAVILTATSISTLRFEIPIPNAASSVEAKHLIIAAILNTTLVTTLVAVLIIVGIFNERLDQIVENKHKLLVWLIPIGVWLSCIFNTMHFYALRERQYVLISKVRVGQSLIGNAVQIILGLLVTGPTGLLFGFLIQTGLSGVAFAKHLAENKKYWVESFNVNILKKTYKKYSNYLRYSTPEAFFHMSSLQIPFLLIGYFVSPQESGLIFMANRIMQLPVSVIGGSIAQFFTGELQERIRLKELNIFFQRTIKRLLLLAILPTIFLGTISYFLLSPILGEEWQRAGLMALIMIPSVSIQIIASATGSALYATSNERSAFKIHFYGFWIRIIILVPVCIYYPDFAFISYVLGGFMHYALYLKGINNACRNG